jgi:hypothetical protein
MSRPVIDREQRTIPALDLEVRVSKDGDPPRIEGYAAVFNQPSEILSDFFTGSYREYVATGAFSKTLKDGADVRALLNHDPNFVLGRTRTNTLSLREDDKGLFYSVTPPDTQWARDLMAVMRRGDIDQSSFAFKAVKDRWSVGKTADGGDIDERWLLEAQLFDVSPVTYPAYPDSSSSVRSLFMSLGLDDRLLLILDRSRRGLPPHDADHALIRATIDRLRAYLPPEPVSADHSDSTALPEPAPTGHSVLRRVEPVPIDAMRAQRLRARLDRMAKL